MPEKRDGFLNYTRTGSIFSDHKFLKKSWKHIFNVNRYLKEKFDLLIVFEGIDWKVNQLFDIEINVENNITVNVEYARRKVFKEKKKKLLWLKLYKSYISYRYFNI